jgi:predicted transcriptional regulator
MNEKQAKQLKQLLENDTVEHLTHLVFELAQKDKEIYESILRFEIQNETMDSVDDFVKAWWTAANKILKKYVQGGYIASKEEEKMLTYLADIRQVSDRISLKLRQKIFKDSFVLKEKELLIEFDFDRFLLGLCETKDDFLNLADFYEASDNQIHQEIAVTLLQNYGKEADYLTLRKKNLRRPKDFLNLAEHLLEQWEDEKALDYAWQGMELKTKESKAICVNFLARYYLDKKDDEGLKRLILCCKSLKKLNSIQFPRLERRLE